MPHYRNGQLASLNDLIQYESNYGYASIGFLVQISAGDCGCNGQLLPIARRWSKGASWHQVFQSSADSVTLAECVPLIPAPEVKFGSGETSGKCTYHSEPEQTLQEHVR